MKSICSVATEVAPLPGLCSQSRPTRLQWLDLQCGCQVDVKSPTQEPIKTSPRSLLLLQVTDRVVQSLCICRAFLFYLSYYLLFVSMSKQLTSVASGGWLEIKWQGVCAGWELVTVMWFAEIVGIAIIMYECVCVCFDRIGIWSTFMFIT